MISISAFCLAFHSAVRRATKTICRLNHQSKANTPGLCCKKCTAKVTVRCLMIVHRLFLLAPTYGDGFPFMLLSCFRRSCFVFSDVVYHEMYVCVCVCVLVFWTILKLFSLLVHLQHGSPTFLDVTAKTAPAVQLAR